MSWIKTFAFWNSSQNVNYFSQKPADPRIIRRLERLLESRNTKDNQMTALDLGCGGGRHTEMLVKMGFQTSVMDLNPQMLLATIKRVGKKKLKVAKRGSIVKLPFASEIFDVLVTTGVLHQAKNIHEYEAAIKEVSRVLKPSGVVCLNIFTSRVIDESYKRRSDTFAYQTKEGLDMTLLSKTTFYELMAWYGLMLEEELSEDIVDENTGKRSVLRCNFVKVIR